MNFKLKKELIRDISEQKIPSEIAFRFHHALAILIADVADHIQCPQIDLLFTTIPIQTDTFQPDTEAARQI